MNAPSIRIESIYDDEQVPVTLEPARAADLAELWPLDRSVTWFHPTEAPNLFESSETVLASLAPDEAWQISVAVGRDAMKLAGLVGLANWGSAAPSIGTYIMDPEQRGHGVGTRAQVGVAAYANQARIPNVRAYTLVANSAERRALHKSGFVELLPPVDELGNMPMVPYGDGKQNSSWSRWTMVPPGGFDYDLIFTDAAKYATKHFADTQAKHRVIFE